MSKHWTDLLSAEDLKMVIGMLGDGREPDLSIEPNGHPYLYRWFLIPRTRRCNVYLHIQVASDPERPVHDHPWDNQSTILAGGYDEIFDVMPWWGAAHVQRTRHVRAGDVVQRRASEAHRLILPPEIPYTISLFSTGPVVRDWGFWKDGHFYPHDQVISMTADQRSVLNDGAFDE